MLFQLTSAVKEEIAAKKKDFCVDYCNFEIFIVFLLSHQNILVETRNVIFTRNIN